MNKIDNYKITFDVDNKKAYVKQIDINGISKVIKEISSKNFSFIYRVIFINNDKVCICIGKNFGNNPFLNRNDIIENILKFLCINSKKFNNKNITDEFIKTCDKLIERKNAEFSFSNYLILSNILKTIIENIEKYNNLYIVDSSTQYQTIKDVCIEFKN